ncbi:MAG: SPOR domain-containing protein [Gemmatimonadales bacterium]
MRRSVKLLLTVAVISAPHASIVAAQGDSILRDSLQLEAIRLATEGQGDSARAFVRSYLASLSPDDSLYAEMLYTAGLVADNTDSALTYYRRVSIEHANSGWADKALLRIAQLSFVAGELRPAIRSADRILLDYPFSDALPEAAYWSGRARLELGDVEQGCSLLERAQAGVGENFELANRVRYYLQRCAALAANRTGDSATPGPSKPEAPGGRTVFSVQVSAVASAAAADEMMRKLNSQGYKPHVIRDSHDGLLKIRVGRFAKKAQAQKLAAELRRKIGGKPFVVEES